MVFSTSAYLCTNYAANTTVGTPHEFDSTNGDALTQINSTRYLCAYEGDGDDGWTVVLMPKIEAVLQ
jgi:hypothetical protein